MRQSNYENIFEPQEDNNFSEYKSFKAEDYFIKENCDFSKDFKVKENHSDENASNFESKTINSNIENIENINKLTKITENITTSIASHSSVLVTSAIAVISASVVGLIPAVNVGASEAQILTSSIQNKPLINEIVVEGKIINTSINIQYLASVNQFAHDDTLEVDGMCQLNIDKKSNFTFSIDAYYGLTSYQYDIFYFDNEEKRVVLYSSPQIEFNLNQDYSATYDKVNPRDSKFTFKDDGTVNVHIDTNYTSDYEYVYKYQLSILDREGNVLAEYLGNEPSIDLSIDNCNVGEIFYEYVDIGEFASANYEYDRYLLDNYSVVELPTINFSESIEFVDDKFALTYSLQSSYDYSSLSLDLTISNEKETITKTIEGLSEKSLIILDEFEGEIGEVEITGILNFKDELLDKYSHQIKLQKHNYIMDYYFNVTRVQADVYESGLDSIPLTFNFDYRLPSTYKLSVSNNSKSVNEIIDLTENYYLSSAISSGDGGTLELSILDNNNAIWKEPITYNILSQSAAQSKYVMPAGATDVNSGDVLVTYNDDGTINIYRDLKFINPEPNMYYDAFIYSDEQIDEVTGQKIYVNGIHSLSNERYSIIENVEDVQYLQHYYRVLYENSVYYYVNMQWPSGSIDSSTLDISFNGTYDSSTNKTTITLTLSGEDAFKKECIINGTTYAIDFVDGSYVIVADGNVINETLTIYGSPQHKDYNTLKEAISLKGNEYKSYNFTINE